MYTVVDPKSYNRETNIECPISGKPLLYKGKKSDRLDEVSIFSPEKEDEVIIYYNHPFNNKCYHEINSDRYFYLNADNKLEEVVRYKDLYFPIELSEEEIKIEYDIIQEKNLLNNNSNLSFGLGKVERVNIKTISANEIWSNPMSKPLFIKRIGETLTNF